MTSILLRSSKLQMSKAIKRYVSSSTKITQDSELFKELFKQNGGKWWNSSDPQLKTLENLNKLRVPLITQFIAPMHGNYQYANTDEVLKDIKMLDVGCGGGFLSEALAELGAEVTGLEPVKELVQDAKEHAALNPNLTNLQYETISVGEMSRKHPAYYDVVVASEVIEHVNEPEDFLGDCLACLRPGGSIVLTTMSKNWLGGFCNIYLAENVTKIISKGVHEYSMFVHPKKLQEMLTIHKCSTIDVKGFWINTFTAECHLMPVTWFNYAIHAVKHK